MAGTKSVVIDPITRLEGHGKIDIRLNEQGNVDNAYLQVVELRGFERFCMGRPAEELPRITPRICGVCPSAHHMAATKCVDDLFNVDPPSAAKKVRELYYSAHMAHSHILHLYALAGPDFIVGYDADPAKRNIVGVIEKVGLELGKEVIVNRGYCQRIQAMIGGKATHSVFGLPGGNSKPITEAEREEMKKMTQSVVEFAKKTRTIFVDTLTKNETVRSLVESDGYKHETYYMGLVDSNGAPNFYDGELRVIDPEGNHFAQFKSQDYLDHIEEHVEPWTYLKFPYLKKVGWKGLVDGKESGIYRAAPLARVNVADKMATPVAEDARKEMMEFFGGGPVHHTLGFHWARAVELAYAAERLAQLVEDPEITSTNVRAKPNTPDEGVGIVEAPRGTLIHHYKSDPDGMTTDVNLIVATGHNNGGMCLSVKKAAQTFIKDGHVDQGILNMVEMAFRAYDPCLACATHDLTGTPMLDVRVFDHTGKQTQTISRKKVA